MFWNKMHHLDRPANSQARLRILHILPSLGVGGAEQMAGYLATGLAQSHDVSVAGLSSAWNSTIEARLSQAGVHLWHLGKGQGFEPRMYRALDRLLARVQPQVVHTHLSVLRYVFPVLLRRRVPVAVHTLHNLAEYETDVPGRVIQWLAFRSGVHPVAISRECSASIRRFYGRESCAIIPNCIPVTEKVRDSSVRMQWRAQQGFASDAVLFTCVGRFEPQKNPLLLIRAFAKLTGSRAHLVFLGEGSLREEVIACIRTHRLEERVHLLGKRYDIPDALAASDAFVLASNWEGNPLSVMEAMAAGLPVIGTAVGGVPELVESGRSGLLVPPEDSAAFGKAMQLLLDDPAERAAMGHAARLRALASFRVERMVSDYENLYYAALSGSGHVSLRSAETAA